MNRRPQVTDIISCAWFSRQRWLLVLHVDHYDRTFGVKFLDMATAQVAEVVFGDNELKEMHIESEIV